MAPRAPHTDASVSLARHYWQWFVSCLLVFTLLALLVVIHSLQARPMEFFYVLF